MHSKLKQTWSLKTTEIFSFITLESRSPKLRSQQGWFLLEPLMRICAVPLSLWLFPGTWGSPSHADASCQSFPPPSHGVFLCVSLYPFLL